MENEKTSGNTEPIQNTLTLNDRRKLANEAYYKFIQKQIAQRNPNSVATTEETNVCWVTAEEAHQIPNNAGLFMQYPKNVKVLFKRRCK